MRLQAQPYRNEITIVYYDSEFNMLDRKTLPSELELFGGFYCDGNNYYLVTGQENPNEDDSVEVYRVTKYDKNWKRLGSCGLYGENTTIPFDAGKCSMDKDGKFLIVRTSHEMYKSSDGRNHQANVTFEVDTDAMKVVDALTSVSGNYAGYVSHSFNQLVRIDDHKIVAVDHGDAHPRSICLMLYPTDLRSELFNPVRGSSFSSGVNTIGILNFPGATGDNYTGASVGGLEVSDTSYLIAGDSVRQDDNYTANNTRNVWIGVVNKNTQKVELKWLTDYAEGSDSASTPKLVKINSSKYMILWDRGDTTYYTYVNGNGLLQSDIYSHKGSLSDCEPVVANGKISWYEWYYSKEDFYQISVNNPEQFNVTNLEIDHQYEWKATENGVATFVCSKCGGKKEEAVPVDFTVYWKNNNIEDNTYYAVNSLECDISDSIRSWMAPNFDDNNLGQSYEYIIESDKPDKTVIEEDTYSDSYKNISFRETGECVLTAYPKYNPDLKKTYTVNVVKPLENVNLKVEPIDSATFGNEIILSAETVGGGSSTLFTFSATDDQGTEQIISSYYTNTCSWYPEETGTYTLSVTAEYKSNVISNTTSYVIEPANTRVCDGESVTANSIIYGQKISDSILNTTSFVSEATGTSVSGELRLDDPETVLTAGTHKVTWYFEPYSDNYKGCKGETTLTVQRAQHPDKMPAEEYSIPYTSKSATNNILSEADGWEFSNADLNIVLQPGVSTVLTAEFQGADKDNYEITVADIRVTREQCTHNKVTILPASVATCTEQGLTEGKLCPTCGEVIVKQTQITALGHNYKEVPGTAINATCVKAGKAADKKCSRCGSIIKGDMIEALGHKWGAWKITSNATCVAAGAREKICSVCGDKVTETIPATGHKWDTEYTVDKAATCTVEGSESIHCSVCDEIKAGSSRTIPKTAHKYSAWKTTKAATCTATGTREKVCTDCGDKVTETIAATGHKWNTTYTVDKAPTYAEEGSESIHCAVCGESKEGSAISIAKLEPSSQTGADGTAVGQGASEEAATEAITGMASDNDIPGTVFNVIQLKSTKQTNTSLTLSWKKVADTTSYVIYGNKCGKNNKMKELARVKGISKGFSSVAGKKVAKGTYYKFMVVALDRDNKVISTSKVIHVATKGGKVGNNKKVTTKAKKNKVTIKKGKTFKLAAKAKPVSKKLKVKKHRGIVYETTNANIATVSKKGIIKGKSKGTCYVYAYAQNGVFAKIKVTIK